MLRECTRRAGAPSRAALCYADAMDKREALYDLATGLPAEHLDEALAALRSLMARVKLYTLEDAPYADEQISERETAKVASAV